jgi:kynurenine 3-monooxygenase
MIVSESAASVSIEPLDHGYKELTLPPGFNGDPQLDPHALHIWPRGGYMVIALANLDHSFTCTLFAPVDAGPHSFAALDTAEAIEAFFADQFRDFASLVPDLSGQFLGNPDGSLATVRCRGWHVGDRAVILGDAAHAIVPFHGQGMNAAFESCSLLMRSLAAHPEDWEAAFSSFESARKPDVDAIADMALDNYIEMRSSVADDRYLLRRELALELERRWPSAFTPRYSMVMFSTMPYAEAQRRARQQSAILEQLTDNVNSLTDVDFDRAAELIGGLTR